MKKFNLNIKTLNILLLIISVLLIISNIYINDKAVTLGNKFTATYQNMDEHIKYNQFLSYELSRISSNDEIFKRATESNFVKADLDFITPSPLAYR